MILKRFYDERLAHASYLVGCPGAGKAVIVDPNRDLDQYMQEAETEGMQIVFVAETHIHADYLSGARELALRTGAELIVSDLGPADWKYEYEGNLRKVVPGDVFQIGALRFDVIDARGHTPEQINFVLTDEAVSPEPMAVFSGDFVFVGDVGRPDLLENAANILGTAEPGARQAFKSLQEFKKLPDHVLVCPAHGAGSPCGKSLGGVPFSTVGYEKRTNWAFQIDSEDEFVREVLSNQPEPPVYFAQMKSLNKIGPNILGGFKSPHRSQRDSDVLDDQVLVLDIRPSDQYLAGHIYKSLHAPISKSFTMWVGWYVPYDQDIVLVAESQTDADVAAKALAMIGVDRVTKWVGPDVLFRLQQMGELRSTESLCALDISEPAPSYLDVRGKTEFDSANIEGALHVPMGYLGRQVEKIRSIGGKVYVHCQSGGRSPVAMSVLERLGITSTVNVTDGFAGLSRRAALPDPLPKPCTGAMSAN